MENFIVIPGTDIRIYDGYVVTFTPYPGDVYIAKFGYYMLNGSLIYGWYLLSVKDETYLELSNGMLSNIHIVSPIRSVPESSYCELSEM